MARRSLTPADVRPRGHALVTGTLTGTLVLACLAACGGTDRRSPANPSTPSQTPLQPPSQPVSTPVNIAAADWDQGLGLGTSPDARVSAEWIQRQHAVRTDAVVKAGELRALWSKPVDVGAEFDGRFGAQASAPVTAAVVVYDLTIALIHDGAGTLPRHVRVLFTSLATASISRYWDGYGLIDGQLKELRHVPGSPTTTLADVELTPASPTRVLLFRAMVPGLTSIPQALWLESR